MTAPRPLRTPTAPHRASPHALRGVPQATEELEGLKEQYDEKITELESTIERLEATVDQQQQVGDDSTRAHPSHPIRPTSSGTRMPRSRVARTLTLRSRGALWLSLSLFCAQNIKDIEAEAEEECERLRSEGEAIVRQLQSATEETDLKRETSRKLKEEIIDNDRLTVANLNRIKSLEAMVEQHSTALEEAEDENTKLRAELAQSIDPAEAAREMEGLRDLLAEREAQLMAMSRRLQDALENGENHAGGLNDKSYAGARGVEALRGSNREERDDFVRAPGRRDSFLERFGLGKTMGSPPMMRGEVV